MENTFTFQPNYDGVIEWEGEKTLDLYRHLNGSDYNKKNEMSRITSDRTKCFFAFNNEQFKEGYDTMKPHLAEGEKIISIGAGCYFSKSGYEMFLKACDNIGKRIKEECDPQEVYCYEYNNHECMYSGDGDLDVMRMIIDYYGVKVAKGIERFNAFWSVDEIKNMA